MKVNHQHPNLSRQAPIESRQEAQKVQGTQSRTSQNAGPASTTHLSQAATDTSQDVDSARVEEVRAAIREGRLEIHAERIADGLIASVQDLLNQKGEGQ